MKTVECIGKTVEDATAAALKQLGVSREKADILILDEGSRGILGLGAKMARVRATEIFIVSASVSVATNFLRRVATLMGLPEPTIDIKEEGDLLSIMVDGENVGPMIGHHGDALDALQLLTGLVVNPQGHDSEKYYHVTLDVSHYRERREETLIRLATRLAEKAEETGEPQELEPMNSYERRIIHTALADFPGISTWSEGDDPYRHVIIALEAMDDEITDDGEIVDDDESETDLEAEDEEFDPETEEE
jgi:spoIIIJ-associated protein